MISGRKNFVFPVDLSCSKATLRGGLFFLVELTSLPFLFLPPHRQRSPSEEVDRSSQPSWIQLHSPVSPSSPHVRFSSLASPFSPPSLSLDSKLIIPSFPSFPAHLSSPSSLFTALSPLSVHLRSLLSILDPPSSTLKYRNGLPVLARAAIVSRPSVHLYVDSNELKSMLTGGRIKHRAGMGMGEIAVVRTKDGRYLEGWEAFAEGVGGEVICKMGGQ